MLESYEDLVSGLSILSNHFQKYLRFVKKSSFYLRQRLDDCGLTGKVHLWRKSHNYQREMQYIISVAQDQKEIRVFLGTYFILQILQLHFINIDWLRREVWNDPDRLNMFRQILTRFRFQLRNLVSCYLSALFEVFAGESPQEGIAFCNVGMILDQDDLDVGIFISDSMDRSYWNRIVSQVSSDFMKYSTKMHFYLAELVAPDSFLISVSDINNYINRNVHDFVLVSELLVTEFLFGDEKLIQKLEREIIDRFYFEKGNPWLHEGYLRGMIGEIQVLLRFDLNTTWISPKNQGLRLIHSLMNIMKTIHGFYEHGSRDALEYLKRIDTQNMDLYQNLENIFNFIEMFSYVYQIVVSVDDTFDCSDGTTLDNLDVVAKMMGFVSYGVVRPGIRLMTKYYENMETLSRIGREFQGQINTHLKKITVFNSILRDQPLQGYPLRWTDNKALNSLKLFRVFSGLVYWDDILQILGDNDGEALRVIVQNIEKLDVSRRMHTFNRLLKLLFFDMDSIVMVGVLLARHIRDKRLSKYTRHMREWLIRRLEDKPMHLVSFINLIRTHPSMLAEFLLTLSNPQLLVLVSISKELKSQEDPDPEYRNKFTILCKLIAFSSNHYLRILSRVVKVRPEIVTYINDMSVLDGISIQLWSGLAEFSSPETLKEHLEMYYQFSFCKCGLITVNQPGDIKLLYGSYNSFFRRYFRWLYRACQWAVDQQGNFEFYYREQDEDDQPLAFFCTGGYAREEAFENDIDLIVVSYDSDPEFVRYASRIVNEINRELRKQGIIPHYRFSEFFNSFIVSIETISQFLSVDRGTDFIEFSQLLGSRLLIGGRSFDIEFTHILEQHLFKNPHRFISKLLAELRQRNEYQRGSPTPRGKVVNVKEDPGALRDIQIIVTACQAYVGLREPVIWEVIQILKHRLPELEHEFNMLERAYQFMRFFKDIYALSLSGANDIVRERLIDTIHRMDLDENVVYSEEDSVTRLLNRYRYHRYRSQQAIACVSRFLTDQIK
ncbi:hypothetical protein JXA40_06510 [bacterium]|nr:hypothetical protein [candidate division CSSED10-310 bacterium]